MGCRERINLTEEKIELTFQEKKIFSAGGIYADNQFKGARLNDFVQLNDSTYQALILPENTPINKSPWYGFRIWSDTKSKIQLNIDYGEDYRHRFIPKISFDGIEWEVMADSLYTMDSLSGSVMLDLELDTQSLWISAQENLNQAYINAWMDSLATKSNVSLKQVGESVLGNPIPLITIKEESAQKSILFIGRQHPPEVPGGTMALIDFVDYIMTDSERTNAFRKYFEVLVFPLLNPDGVDEGHWRHNANGKDLNRDWIAFTEPETRAVRDYLLNADGSIKESRAFAFGIDFHTSYTGPFLLILDTIPKSVEPIITNKWIEQIAWQSEEELDIRPRPQVKPYCYNWMINAFEMEAVTYEEGDEVDRTLVHERASLYASVLVDLLLESVE